MRNKNILKILQENIIKLIFILIILFGSGVEGHERERDRDREIASDSMSKQSPKKNIKNM